MASFGQFHSMHASDIYIHNYIHIPIYPYILYIIYMWYTCTTAFTPTPYGDDSSWAMSHEGNVRFTVGSSPPRLQLKLLTTVPRSADNSSQCQGLVVNHIITTVPAAATSVDYQLQQLLPVRAVTRTITTAAAAGSADDSSLLLLLLDRVMTNHCGSGGD